MADSPSFQSSAVNRIIRMTKCHFGWLAICALIVHAFLPFAMPGGIGPWTPISSYAYFSSLWDSPLGAMLVSVLLLVMLAILLRPFIGGRVFRHFARVIMWLDVMGIASLLTITILSVNITAMSGYHVLMAAFILSFFSLTGEKAEQGATPNR